MLFWLLGGSNPCFVLFHRYHLVASYSGLFMSFYVNGRMVSSSTSQTGQILYPSSGTFVIAAFVDSPQALPQTLNGMLASVAIWDNYVGPEAAALMYSGQRNTTVFVCPECPPGTVSTGKCQGIYKKQEC
jgi:hypothetical protein